MTLPSVPVPLEDVVLRRLRLLVADAAEVTQRKKFVYLAELAGLGYRVTNPDDYSDAAPDRFHRTVELLREMRGGNVPYVPLFSGFPENVPEEKRYFLDRLIGFVTNITGLTRDHSWLFDLEKFGADPVYQSQRKDLFEAALERQKSRAGDKHVEWVTLQFASRAVARQRASEYLRESLYARSSIPEVVRPDLFSLLMELGTSGIEPAQVVFKETRTLLSAFHWLRGELASVADYCSTPTDLLRLFAALTGGDVSLGNKIKFPHLSRAQRRFVLERLEHAPALEEDLNRYRGLWLALGRGLHPGAEGLRFPRVAAAFAALRKGRLETYSSRLEAAVAARDVEAALDLLSQRPGVFGRKLHEVLEKFAGSADHVLERFAGVATQLPVKNLLMLESYFETIETSIFRAIFNKKGKILVQPNRRGRLPDGLAAQVCAYLHDAIQQSLSRRPSWSGKKVWVDPTLRNYTVPLQLRKASEGLRILGRGSRVPLDVGKVLRLFVYWKEAARRTDLDLTLVEFDETMKYIGHVSYTKLAADGIVHSGDLQSAPLGAAEFIDIDLHKVRGRARYLAPQIYRFSGDFFGMMTCHCGWMLREQVDSSYASFDIKTVQNKLDMAGNSAYCIPMLVDLEERQVLYIDLYVAGVEGGNRVEGAVNDVSTIVREMVRLRETRPNLERLALHHARARGAQVVEARDDADITFGVHGCVYGPDRFEKVLAELL
jgi:hypothetical protein